MSRRLLTLVAAGFLCTVSTVYGAAAPAATERNDDLAQDANPAVRESAARIEADVRFLADDLLEGREAGTRGFDLAALYVATQYRLAGLQPAGENGSYFQTVPMLRGVRERDAARLAITRHGTTTDLKFEEEFLPALDYATGECALTAPMVFVGQGIVAPELKHDDFAGVDLRGKVAVMLANAPPSFSTDQRAYYSDYENKARGLVQRGAVGVIALGDPLNEKKYPWKTGAANWRRPGMRVLGTDGKPLNAFPELRCVARVPESQAARLFAGSPYTPEAVYAAFEKGQLKAFDLAGTVTLASQTKLERVTSRNVVAKIAGSGAPAAEHVVLTAHLDHVGIGAPVNGDAIYNGAQDNAVGIAALLEAGRLLAPDRSKLRRSVLFVATTAEEKGLLGAQYFAANPTVPKTSMVANVNLDMPTHIAPVTDLIPYGIEHSTLAPIARKAVGAAGLTLTPDPMPEEVIFVRSDQYPFIREGVPAVYIGAGIHRVDGQDGLAAVQAWMQQHYHQPSDDVNHPIDWVGAARLAIVNRNIAYAISTQRERPRWNAGDFFGGKFARQ